MHLIVLFFIHFFSARVFYGAITLVNIVFKITEKTGLCVCPLVPQSKPLFSALIKTRERQSQAIITLPITGKQQSVTVMCLINNTERRFLLNKVPKPRRKWKVKCNSVAARYTCCYHEYNLLTDYYINAQFDWVHRF